MSSTICPICGSALADGRLICESCTLKLREPSPAPEPTGFGGWLLFFVISLTVVNPLGLLISSAKWMLAGSGLAAVIGVINAVLALGAFVIGLRLALCKSKADVAAKFFLMVLAQWAVMEPFLAGFAKGNLVQLGLGKLVLEVVLGLGYPALWFAYLTRSVRVKNTFAPQRFAAAKRLGI